MILRSCIGIELMGGDLRMAVVGKTARHFRSLQHASIAGFAKMSDGDRAQALRSAAKTQQVRGGRCFLSLPHDLGVIRQCEFPAEVGPRLSEVIALQLESLSPWAVDEVYHDYSPKSPAAGSPFVATIAIVPKRTLDYWVGLFREAGLALSGISFSPLSLARFPLVANRSDAPWLLIRQEGDRADVVLVDQPRLYISSAEDAAPGAGEAMARRLTAAARLGDASRLQTVQIGGVSPESGRDLAQTFHVENLPSNSLQIGAVAAAFSGLGKGVLNLNLIPRPMRRGSNRVLWIPTIVLSAAVLILLLLTALREPYQSRIYGESVRRSVMDMTPAIRELTKEETQLNALQNRQRQLTAEVNPDRNLEVLSELAKVLPQDSWIDSFSNQNGVVSLAGFANSAATIQKTLEDSPVFSGVQFVSPITRDGAQDHFVLRCSLEEVR